MAEIVSRIYSNFRGVDFRGEEINLVRSPDALNVWKDYKETESIRTRPGMKKVASYEAPIHGIYFYKGEMLVHSGTELHGNADLLGSTCKLSQLNDSASSGFVYEDVFYFKDGNHYMRCTEKEGAFYDVEGYVPTTTIARKPAGGGTKYEDVNMLSDLRKNSFLGDGTSKEYWLDAQELDMDYHPLVVVNGQWYEEYAVYEVDYEKGKITFQNAPPKPLTDGQDNVVISFKKTVPGYRQRILDCTMLQIFDNRVFFSGDPKYPNVVWHCSLNDPSYVSDLDYYIEGMDTAKVKGMVAGNNALWVFREPSDGNTTVFYHTPSIDDEYGKVYPSVHSSITTGCVGKAINFNDDIVFFSERGMEGISGDVTTEQVIAHRSSMVDRKMTSQEDYTNMVLEEWKGYLFVFIGDKVYLADSRAMFTNENHMEYEWFMWQLPEVVTCAKVNDGVLYVGTQSGGVYTFTDNEADVESWWTTPLDKFKSPHKFKTTNKKSCTVEAEGEEIRVYAKSNRDSEYELLDTFYDVTDAFCCRIKKKKFKDLQLKFYSPKRFSLETATLEVFVGGYLKNL